MPGSAGLGRIAHHDHIRFSKPPRASGGRYGPKILGMRATSEAGQCQRQFSVCQHARGDGPHVVGSEGVGPVIAGRVIVKAQIEIRHLVILDLRFAKRPLSPLSPASGLLWACGVSLALA